MEPRIKLNVGGMKFETFKSTLISIPYFENYFERWELTSEEIFIDRDGEGFRHVLNLARNPEYDFPVQYKLELEFYGFEYQFIEEPVKPDYYTKEEIIELFLTSHHGRCILCPGNNCYFYVCDKTFCKNHECQYIENGDMWGNCGYPRQENSKFCKEHSLRSPQQQ